MSNERKPWLVTYVYDNPPPAGPFRGRIESDSKLKRGDSVRGLFGAATVKSCRPNPRYIATQGAANHG